MRLNKEQKEILKEKKGKILQIAMKTLTNYGIAMGAKEFIPISSAHTSFLSMKYLAMCFLSKRVQLTENEISRFSEALTLTQVQTKTTINPGIIDLENWRQMGADEATYNKVKETTRIARKCGVLATYSCIPYLTDNIPLIGQNCAWAETSASLYINSILGARTNRESYETSLFSALLGVTPNYGMHLDENRKGNVLIDVQCEFQYLSDWGVLGFFVGEKVGLGIPVFANLQSPTVEEAKQLAAAMNVTGGLSLFHIAGVTPEAPTIRTAFKGSTPRKIYTFDKFSKRNIYKLLNYEPKGKVNMVFLGCPHATLQEIKEICEYLEGNSVAEGTKLWIMTSYSIKASAERLGYDKLIKASGGELFSDGCLNMYYSYDTYHGQMPKLERVATNSVKQAVNVKRAFGSKVVFSNTMRCIEIAVDGECYHESC